MKEHFFGLPLANLGLIGPSGADPGSTRGRLGPPWAALGMPLGVLTLLLGASWILFGTLRGAFRYSWAACGRPKLFPGTSESEPHFECPLARFPSFCYSFPMRRASHDTHHLARSSLCAAHGILRRAVGPAPACQKVVKHLLHLTLPCMQIACNYKGFSILHREVFFRKIDFCTPPKRKPPFS